MSVPFHVPEIKPEPFAATAAAYYGKRYNDDSYSMLCLLACNVMVSITPFDNVDCFLNNYKMDLYRSTDQDYYKTPKFSIVNRFLCKTASDALLKDYSFLKDNGQNSIMNQPTMKFLSSIRVQLLNGKQPSSKQIMVHFKTCVCDALVGMAILRNVAPEQANSNFLYNITKGSKTRREYYFVLNQLYMDNQKEDTFELQKNESYFDPETEGTRIMASRQVKAKSSTELKQLMEEESQMDIDYPEETPNPIADDSCMIQYALSKAKWFNDLKKRKKMEENNEPGTKETGQKNKSQPQSI